MILPVFAGILDVGKAVAAVVGQFLSYSAQRRTATADYFDQIADSLAAFGPKLRSGATPDDLATFCGQFQAFAEQLPATIGDVVGEEEARELSQKLDMAHQSKSLILQANDPNMVNHLTVLAEAAGYFRGSAVSLRAKT